MSIANNDQPPKSVEAALARAQRLGYLVATPDDGDLLFEWQEGCLCNNRPCITVTKRPGDKFAALEIVTPNILSPEQQMDLTEELMFASEISPGMPRVVSYGPCGAFAGTIAVDEVEDWAHHMWKYLDLEKREGRLHKRPCQIGCETEPQESTK